MSTQPKTLPYSSTVFNYAVSGAVVGGTAAAALSIRKVKKGIMTKEDAVKTVAREAGTAGAATGTAAAVVGGLGLGGLLSLVGMALVATGTKYMLDQAFAPEPKVCEVPVAVKQEKPVKKKAPAKKVAAKKTAAKKTSVKKKATPAGKAAAPAKAAAKKDAEKSDTDK